MQEPVRLYLDLMKRVLTNFIYEDPDVSPWGKERFDPEARTIGKDWPRDAHTMVGLTRLDNLQTIVETVLAEAVPGDLLEAGVWRGGASIFMRAVLKAHGVTDRVVWVADSFQGLPPPNPELYPQDREDRHYEYADILGVSLAQVQANFARYQLLDDQVRFIPGWFSQSLSQATVERLALLRVDADMYESTLDALGYLYPRLSPGGYVIIDDYHAISACKQAVTDFRRDESIHDEIHTIDWAAAYWRRSA